MKSHMFKAILFVSLLVPSFAFAAAREDCQALFSISYVEREPGTRELPIDTYWPDLIAVGVFDWKELEVGGNRAIVCFLLNPGARFFGPLLDMLHGRFGATRVANWDHVRILADAPHYIPMRDEVTGRIVFQDGADGRPLNEFHHDNARRIQILRDWAFNRRQLISRVR